MSLVARHLEAKGLPTVILGSALDIVTHCRVPRFLFTDFPLGNPCGVPNDAPMQARVVRAALDVLVNAEAAETVVRSPERWPQGDGWRERYAEVREEDRARLLAAGEARRADRAKIPPRSGEA